MVADHDVKLPAVPMERRKGAIVSDMVEVFDVVLKAVRKVHNKLLDTVVITWVRWYRD